MIQTVTSQDYINECGPWLPLEEVAENLGVTTDTVEALRSTDTFLGVRHPDGKDYYPARQFDMDGYFLVPGFGRITKNLATKLSQVSMIDVLSQPADDEHETYWELVRALPLDDAVAWAEQKLATYVD